MTLEGFLSLISGPIGALALLSIGFAAFARMILSGTLVPGRYYNDVVKENAFLREKLDASFGNTDRALDKVAPNSRSIRREP